MPRNRLSGCGQRGGHGAGSLCRSDALRARGRLRSWPGEFPRRFRRRARGAPMRDRHAKRSLLRRLQALVHGAVVLVNHVVARSKAEETFGVADKKKAVGIQAAMKFFDETLLFGPVEIDHHVAAENDVVALREVFGFEVVEIELNETLERGLDGILVADLVEITEAAGIVHGFHLRFGVDTL